MKALILIGGLGTRLRPLTCTTPKPLLPIVNRPFLEYQLELLKRHGVKELIFCVSYMSHVFEDYFGSGKKWGLKINYVHEKEPLGTGGAIKNAEALIDEPLLVLNGDILTDIDLTSLKEFHKKNKAMATIALSRVKDPTIYGLVETDKKGKIQRFVEKPSWDEVTVNTINAGIYLLEPQVLDFIPKGNNFSVERGLFPDLLAKKLPLYGYIFKGYWLDIGSVDKYFQVHFDIMSRNVNFPVPGNMLSDNLWAEKQFRRKKYMELKGRLVCGKNVRIGEHVKITGNVCVGSNVSVGDRASISDSIILDNSRVEADVRMERTLIGKKCVIEANSTVSENTVLGDGTVIKQYSKI